MTVYGLGRVQHPPGLVQSICRKPPARHAKMVGALPNGRLIPLQIDAGKTSNAGCGQSAFKEDRLDPFPHLGKRSVPVATNAYDETGRPQNERVFIRRCQKAIRNHNPWERVGCFRWMRPERKSGAFFSRQNPLHRIFEDDRRIIQEGPVDGADGLRVFDPKSKGCGQNIDGRFPMHIGCRRDHGGGLGQPADPACQVVCSAHMPRYETDGECRPFIHDDDRRILGLVHQKTGDESNHDPASHDEDMAPVLSEPMFDLGQKPGEPDLPTRNIGGWGAWIRTGIELFRKKHVAEQAFLKHSGDRESGQGQDPHGDGSTIVTFRPAHDDGSAFRNPWLKQAS